MHELTAAEKEAYVRSVWENVHFITSYRQSSLWRLKFGPIITSADSQDECWDAAYAFTLAREEEVRQVEEEERLLQGALDLASDSNHPHRDPMQRTVKRLKGISDELKRGMRGGSK